ncbi:hypothetical protein CcrSwift_gp201 [Caulobacter phage CcrSwift]|uniref:Uncharacterized protein n=1 Tax=Caulobacter phage CcrSwift TaxID=2927984 RepID=K4JT49_9CAUD|nr:hypothetical protein D870_gp220 [Caulobacter phage CcrSwift]AFU88519.1 hypothetical protein CcrSwift_gp201 [Caulobacter phage CcrSwift]
MATDYWLESLDASFDGEGLFDLWNGIPLEKRRSIAEGIEGSFENYGMAHGHDVIPNPLRTEMDERERRYRRDTQETEDQHYRKVRDLEETIRHLRNRIWDLENNRR